MSHNTMNLDRFSSTDDAFELGDPGLHIVISHINTKSRTYRATASITANNRRFYLPDSKAVIDLEPLAIEFHPSVLDAIQLDTGFRSLWGLNIPAGKDRDLFFDPNAGSGYQQPSRLQKALAPSTWGWGEGYSDDDVVQLLLEDIEAALQRGIHDCLEIGDARGIDVLLTGIRNLADEAEAVIYDSTPSPDTHEGSDPDHCPDGADRPVASGLPAGDW
jgi:hypothetical protein